MPDAADILWFKRQFQDRIAPALAGGPLTADMIAAIACQETGHIWPLAAPEVLIDSTHPGAAVLSATRWMPTRAAQLFRATRAICWRDPTARRMFEIARQALVDMAAYVPGYAGVAARSNKFCHGFGLFQRDLQFFLDDPDYFLERRYERF